MFQPNFKNKFLKKEKKLINKNPKLRKEINKVVLLLLENPQNSILNSHKIIDINGKYAFSSSVNGDIRIIWDYHKEKINILDFLDVGGHSGKNKVYK